MDGDFIKNNINLETNQDFLRLAYRIQQNCSNANLYNKKALKNFFNKNVFYQDYKFVLSATNEVVKPFVALKTGHRKQIFTKLEKQKIKKEYKTETISKRQLAKKLGCSETTIRRILKEDV